MKFCKNCGRMIGDNEQCPCGFGDSASVPGAAHGYPVQQPFAETQPQPTGAYPQNQPAGFPPVYPAQTAAAAAAKPKKKTGLIVVLAILMLGMIGGGIWFFVQRGGSGSYETPVKEFFSGINKKNFKTCADTWTTDYLFKSLANHTFDGSVSECKKSFQEYCSKMNDEMEDFFEDCEDEWNVRSISYSYSIEAKDKLSARDLRDLEEDYDLLYQSNELKEGYELKIKVTVKGSGKSDSATGYFTVVKSSKEGWKLLPDAANEFKFTEFKDAEDLIEDCLDL